MTPEEEEYQSYLVYCWAYDEFRNRYWDLLWVPLTLLFLLVLAIPGSLLLMTDHLRADLSRPT